MRKTVFVALKGGTGKTTTAAFLAIEAARRGRRVLGIDADTKSQGLGDWFTRIALNGGTQGLDITCVPWSHQAGLLVPFIQDQITRAGGEDAVGELVIDSGAEDPTSSAQAAHLCDLALIPLAPTRIDMRRAIATTLALDGTGVAFAFLLTKVDACGLGAARKARKELESQRFAVLDTEINNSREMYDRTGTIPDDTGKYADLATELEALKL